jgi:MFS family permease
LASDDVPGPNDIELTYSRNIVVQLTSGHTFTKKPYSWKVGGLGLLSISGFIGALCAFFIGGKLIDMIARKMTSINGGMRQPEFRLPALVIPALIGPMGVLTFGLCVAHKTPWIGAAFGYGMQGFGLTAVSNVVVTFAVDAYQPVCDPHNISLSCIYINKQILKVAGEALVIVFVIRNTIGALLALFVTDWISSSGVANVRNYPNTPAQ